MGCRKPSTCICRCTVVDIVKSGYDPARIPAYPVEDTGCRCRVEGADFVEGPGLVAHYDISMWVSDTGVLYVSLIFSDPLKPVWTPTTAYIVGDIVRTLDAPSPDNYICVKAGTSGGSEPTWSPGLGAVTTDNDVEWERATEYTGHCLGDVCTGKSGVPGELKCQTIRCYSELLSDYIDVEFPGVECVQCDAALVLSDTFLSVTDNADGTITLEFDDPQIGTFIRDTDTLVIGVGGTSPTVYDGLYPIISHTDSSVTVAAPFLGSFAGTWGAYRILPSMSLTITGGVKPDWQPSTGYTSGTIIGVEPPVWQGSTSYSAGSIVAAPSTGDLYQCIAAGTSGALEPVWQELIGEETGDGSIVWTRVANNSNVWMECIADGTSGGVEPVWNYTGTTTDGSVTWLRRYNLIDWCGETWYLPAESGVSKIVCALVYTNFRTQGATLYSSICPYFVAAHLWRHNGLSMARNYAVWRSYGSNYVRFALPVAGTGYLGGYYTILSNREYLALWDQDFNGFDLRYANKYIGVPRPVGASRIAATGNMGIIAPINPSPTFGVQFFYPPFPSILTPIAYWDAYLLTDDWFTSHTINGILYTWEKGLDWPV